MKKLEGFGQQVPPLKKFVFIYFAQKGIPESEADRFFRHYDACGWKNAEHKPIQNWKTLACEWAWQATHRR